MKNAMILVGLWVGIILTAYALVYVDGGGPTPGQLALLERLAQRTYVDTEGRFQFEAPAGWRVSEDDDVVHLVGPVEEIEAWILVIEDMGAPRAIEIACERTDPCPEKTFVSFEELPPPAFADRKIRITYETDDKEVLIYGVGFVRPGETVVLLVRGDRTACMQRIGELTRIEESLTSAASE